MASSTKIMNANLGEDSRYATNALFSFTHAVATSNIEDMLEHYKIALCLMDVQIISTMVKRALQGLKEQDDKVKFFRKLEELTTDDMSPENLGAIYLGMAQYAFKLESNKDVCKVLIDVVIARSKNEKLIAECAKLRVELNNLPALKSQEPASVQVSIVIDPLTNNGWGIFSSMQYLIQQASRLKNWAVQVEDASDEWLIDSATDNDNSPRPQ